MNYDFKVFLKSHSSVVYEHRKLFGKQSTGNQVILIKVKGSILLCNL